jgi:hypothetical protein
LQLADDHETLHTNFDNVLNAIVEHISNIWVNLNVESNGLVEGILSLPKGAGYFIIRLLPPPHWTRHNFGPVKLLFSFENLYCEGFHRNGHWYVFSDTYLKMEQREGIQGTNVRSLGFSGNYNSLGRVFNSISLGGFALFAIYKSIAQYPGSEIKGPLRLSAVSFSESIRYPKLRQYISGRMSTGVCCAENIEQFSIHFQEWSVYSDMIREGRDAFAPSPGIATFDDLLELIGIIL